MATYGTDLTTLTDAESGTWTEFAAPYALGGTPAADGENYIQGAGCVSQTTGTKSGLSLSIAHNAGSDISSSFSAGDVVLIWQFYAVGPNLETFANGGLRIGIGASTSTIDSYAVGGSDYGRNPYGGWQNVVVDPARAGDYTDGGGNGGAWQYFGSILYTLAAISKGTPHAVDAIRYGRGEIYCTGTGCNFVGLAQYNDYNDASNGYNRFGLFSYQNGIYVWKGLMSLGQSGTSVTFSDSNKAVVIEDTSKTYNTFNKIEINNASSSITWDNVSFKSLGSEAPGHLEVVDNATVAFTGCSFQNMGNFTFLSNSTITDCIFQTISGIDSGGGHFTGSNVLTPITAVNDSAFVWNSSTNPDGYLDNMVFSKGTNSHHAIELGLASATTITLNGITFTDFSTSDEQDDSVIHVLQTSGTVTIQAVECTGTVTYKSEGATVNITQGVVTKVTVKDIDTSAVIENARVLLKVSDATNFPYLDSVTIESTGTEATVTHTTHGLSDNDNIIIAGANEDEYNGSYSITVSGTDYYLYTMNEDPTSPATGTITATFAFLNGLTNGSGVISDQRTLSANQSVVGWIRKASSSPYYKQQPISETVDSAIGKDITVLLIKDE